LADHPEFLPEPQAKTKLFSARTSSMALPNHFIPSMGSMSDVTVFGRLCAEKENLNSGVGVDRQIKFL
jgi:hypothetical protein